MPSKEWNDKGDYYLGSSNFEKAIQCYDNAISCDPSKRFISFFFFFNNKIIIFTLFLN